MSASDFEWDEKKNSRNQIKHGVAFGEAQKAFLDPMRVIAEDMAHGGDEKRFYCIGQVGEKILTVCFTWRRHVIRIIAAGYWRRGRAIYEKQDKIHG